MIPFLLLLFPTPSACEPTPPPAPAATVDDEYDRRLEAAGDDAAKLWEVYVWCESTEREREAKAVLRKIVKTDPDHRQAREKLGHVRYDGQWFTSEKKLEAFKKKEADRLAKEAGFVKYKGEWVHPDDVDFLKKGYVKGDAGQWLTPEEVEKIAEGWVRQDLVWVSPDELSKIDEGLWKCDDEWLSLEDANRHHRQLGRFWVIPSDHVVVWSTCDRALTLEAIDHMERGYRDMVRIFGRSLARPVPVALTRNEDQFRAFCNGQGRHPTTDGRGLVASHRTVFAESWVDRDAKEWRGMGACYWNPEEQEGAYGPHDARMAMGLSVVDAMDPSPKAVERVAKKGVADDQFAESFYGEKTMPEWFRWGAASYASRYFEDSVGTGGDPWWARKWSIQNIARGGGLDDLEKIFDFPIRPDNRNTTKLINEAGLLVAFIVDGACEPVTEQHEALKEALKDGKDTGKIFDGLRKELEKHEAELRAFAGL